MFQRFDRVTFPEILDLNQFVRSESENESPSDDADTTDSGSALDDEAAVTSTSSGPSSSRQANGPCEDMGSDDEGIDVGSGSGSNADAVANARNLKRNVNMVSWHLSHVKHAVEGTPQFLRRRCVHTCLWLLQL